MESIFEVGGRELRLLSNPKSRSLACGATFIKLNLRVVVEEKNMQQPIFSIRPLFSPSGDRDQKVSNKTFSAFRTSLVRNVFRSWTSRITNLF
ncbi:hypothetical protein L596_014154 [Steinernema carpocapsae]|uniref:Uncharacterized protein n=1 Tax=Steinernema carpocapsae TaxID=34508 RepID=A0A4U5NAY3_STECR|nr:hypothetical protein L596_014154 [Steinernema carpocapsae]